jgi:uncharacterized RDD family membrane protein YckC
LVEKAQATFETPEDVHLVFDLAGPGSRMASALIDYLLIALVLFAMTAILIGAGALSIKLKDLFDPEKIAEVNGFALAAFIAAASVLHTGYFIATEWMLSGQSLGKRLLGLRVVRDGGYALSFTASLIRNVARVVDMLPSAYFIGLLSMILSRDRKRLGDFMAGTIVVRHQHETPPTSRFAGERYATILDRRFSLTKDQVEKLDGESLLILDGYFDRAPSLDPEPLVTLRKTIAGAIAQRMAIDLSSADDGTLEAFLKETYLALRERHEA